MSPTWRRSCDPSAGTSGRLAARRFFEALRSPAGDEMILTKNLFVETILPASILRTLEADEMAEYRRPFETAGEGAPPDPHVAA